MILETQINKNVFKSDFESEIKMSVTSDDDILMMILSQNLYSDPIGSIIRELSSNALDATVEAENDEPIIVSLNKDENLQYIFSVQDFGTGISPEKMTNVISKFGESTKRNRVDQLGCYGLGLKSPFSYTDIFFIKTVVDNIEYYYSISKGEKSPTISLLYEISTDKPNGTTFSLSVKQQDNWVFKNKIYEQLAYFNSVYINIDNCHVQNTITDYGLFKHSTLSSNRTFHISLNNVYYSIDYEKLKVKPIDGNVAINFKISDGLLPLPNRESLKYTSETIELIKNKLAEVYDYIYGKFIKDRFIDIPIIKIANPVSFSISEIQGTFKPSGITKPYNTDINIKDFDIKYKSSAFYTSFFSNKLVYHNDYSTIYRTVAIIENNTITGSLKSHYMLYRYVAEQKVIIIDYERYLGLKKYEKMFLKETYSGYSLVINQRPALSLKEYRNLLMLTKETKAIWRNTIKEFQLFIKLIEDTFIKFEDVIPSEEDLITLYKQKRKSITQVDRASKEQIKLYECFENSRGTIVSRERCISPLQSFTDKNSKGKLIVFYDNTKYYDLFRNNNRIQSYYLNQTDYKKVQKLDIHYIKTIDNFMKDTVKPFVDMVTSAIIYQEIENNSFIVKHLDLLKTIQPKLEGLYKELEEFADKNESQSFNANAIEIIKEFCESNNFINPEYKDKIELFRQYCKEFKFIKLLKRQNGYTGSSLEESPEMVSFIKEVWKTNKLKSKLNLKTIKDEQPELEESIAN